MREADKILQTYPEIERRIASINNPNVDISLELSDPYSSLWQVFKNIFTGHNRSTSEIMDSLKKKFDNITGFDLRVRTGGQVETSVVEMVVRGNKTQHELSSLVTQMVSELLQTGLFSGIRTATSVDNEDYIITMQRDKIANIQRTPQEIARTIRYLLKGEKVNKFKKDNKQYDVNLQVYSEFKENPENILSFFIRGGTPKEPILIPLSELVSVDARTSPPEIQRYKRTRAATMVAVLKSGSTVGDGIKSVESIADQIMPEDARVEFIGETQRYITEKQSMLLVFVLSLCFIYLVMAAQFESWRDPFIIFFSVPISLVGGVFALTQLDKGTLNMYSFIGFVTLVGLITKHGILIVDFANRLREGATLSVHEAVIRASKLRLRPILMTTFAMVFGAIPLMLGGVGNESRRQLGCVIIGGMSIGTLFTLFVVPTVYVLLSSKNRGRKHVLDFAPSTEAEVLSPKI